MLKLIKIKFILTVLLFFAIHNGLFSVPLKNANAIFETPTFINKIPRNYDEIESLKFPTNEEIELDFTGFKEGATTGPDGGEVYKWKEGSYKWTLKNGGDLTYWNPTSWQLTKDQFLFQIVGDSGNKQSKNFRLTYPNGSILSKHYLKEFQTDFYYYENYQDNLYYQLFPNQLFNSMYKKVDRFHFYFEPEHEAWIDAFVEGDAFPRFISYINKVGYTSSNQIPVVFFKDASNFRNYIRLPNADCAGGRGGIFGLSFCNLTPLLSYIGTSRDEREKSKTIHHTHMIYHEWGHHLQQVECAIVRNGKNYPAQVHSAWFNEGMAEYLGYVGSSRKRGDDRILFFEKYVLTGKQPSLAKEDPYLLGGQLFRYIAETYGDKSILNLWSSSCKGAKEEELIKNLTNQSPQELLISLFKELSKLKSEDATNAFMKNTLDDWATDALSLKFLNRDNQLPDLSDKNVKPDLKKAFSLDILSIKGKLAGHFTTSRKEQIYLFMNGTYTIRGSDYKVVFHNDQTISYLTQGHEITEWASGRVAWKLPDGKIINF
jgi:hypothetical protein